jgi:hypothetical protein
VATAVAAEVISTQSQAVTKAKGKFLALRSETKKRIEEKKADRGKK